MSRDQGPQNTLTTRNGGNQINKGIPRPIKTASTDWTLLWVAGLFTVISIVLGLGMASLIRSIT